MSKFQIRIQNISKDADKLEKKTRNRSENPFHTTSYYKRTKSVHDQLMNCICWHSYCGHSLGVGKCDYPYCICEEFVQGSVEIWDYSENYIERDDRKYEGGLF